MRRIRRLAVLPQVRKTWQLSERRACAILDVNRKMHYRSVKLDDPALRGRIKEIAAIRIRYGYSRIAVLLRREGWLVNVKRVRRIYREENLTIRTRRPSDVAQRACAKTGSYPTRRTRAGRWTSCTTCSPTAQRSGCCASR
jgi:transposase InsO family protein